MKIYELLSDESKWIQGSSYKYVDGEVVGWCLYGAIQQCSNSLDDFHKLKAKIQAEIGYIVPWNDEPERTYQEVFNLCKELDV